MKQRTKNLRGCFRKPGTGKPRNVSRLGWAMRRIFFGKEAA